MLNFGLGIIVGVLIVLGIMQYATDKNCLLSVWWNITDPYDKPLIIKGEGTHIDEFKVTRSFKVRKENEAQ